MTSSDIQTIQALRSDLALQLARFIKRRELNQVAAAKRLGIPQPTLSKIMNGKVSELSLELLIRIAVRAGLPLTLQIGTDPAEAGVFVSQIEHPSITPLTERMGTRSRVADEARDALLESARNMTPQQRLEAHARHSELVTALHRSGRAAETARLGATRKRTR